MEKAMSRLERPVFFEGQLLSAKDLNEGQKYFLEKQRLHNRFLHGCGVVHGLTINVTGTGARGHTVHVSPGLALDCLGHEIIVGESSSLKLPKNRQEIYIMIKYKEVGSSPVPILTNPADSPTDDLQFSRIKEGFEIEYDGINPWSGHKRSKTGWLTCGKNHGIPLGKLKYEKGEWIKSGTFLPPRIK
jgi:hypothetical protein